MVDCIFETWLQKNPNARYPISSKIPKGHQRDDYIVPFFPLYKHSDMFTTADKFGYQCKIQPLIQSKPSLSESKYDPTTKLFKSLIITAAVETGIIIICILFSLSFCCYCYYKKRCRNKPTMSNRSNRNRPTGEKYQQLDTSSF